MIYFIMMNEKNKNSKGIFVLKTKVGKEYPDPFLTVKMDEKLRKKLNLREHILKKDYEYRVIYNKNIENIYQDKELKTPDPKMIKLYFGDATVYYDPNEAVIESGLLSEEHPDSKNNFSSIRVWEDKTFADLTGENSGKENTSQE